MGFATVPADRRAKPRKNGDSDRNDDGKVTPGDQKDPGIRTQAGTGRQARGGRSEHGTEVWTKLVSRQGCKSAGEARQDGSSGPAASSAIAARPEAHVP